VAGESPKEERLARAQEQFRLGVEKLRQPAEARRLFAQAADEFASLRDVIPSPNLYLCLGNAEALAGRWPHAIWAYQCGLRIDPNHGALREHLQYARALVNDLPNGRGRASPDAWPGWLHRPSSGELLLLGTIIYSLACFAGGWWYVRRRASYPWAALVLCLVALGCSAGYLLKERQVHEESQHPLVIVAVPATSLYRGNGPSYPLHPDVPSLPAGLETRLLHRRGSWLQVQLATGEIGWVLAERVLIVAP
jgi:hypothetical protein